jgi:hypothetical protein
MLDSIHSRIDDNLVALAVGFADSSSPKRRASKKRLSPVRARQQPLIFDRYRKGQGGNRGCDFRWWTADMGATRDIGERLSMEIRQRGPSDEM